LPVLGRDTGDMVVPVGGDRMDFTGENRGPELVGDDVGRGDGFLKGTVVGLITTGSG
jgi:hypothetical protein